MSTTVCFVSDSDLRVRNRGAYSSPFSGVGVEFYPLGVLPDHSGLVLHESGYLACNDWWDFPNTLSPFWRLYYNSRKGHKVIFPAFELELGPEYLVLIPDHQLFHLWGRTAVPNLWCHFNLARRLEPRQTIPVLLPPTRTELDLIHDLVEIFEHPNETGHRERIFHFSLALLHVVLNRPEVHWQERASEAFVETIHYIEEAHTTALSIPVLARMAHMSPESFSIAFKKYQGVTPGRFVTQVRVREAAHLLVNTEETVDTIADKTGLTNRFYLSRVFKKITGESPAHFRRMHTTPKPRPSARSSPSSSMPH